MTQASGKTVRGTSPEMGAHAQFIACRTNWQGLAISGRAGTAFASLRGKVAPLVTGEQEATALLGMVGSAPQGWQNANGN